LSIDPLIQDASTLWQNSPDTFTPMALPYGFQWSSLQRESARTANRDLSLGPLRVIEAQARFSDQKLSSLSLLLYSRGDSGEISREAFEKIIRDGSAHLSTLTRSKPQHRGQDPANAVRAEGLVWKTPGTLWTLEYSAARQNTPRGSSLLPEFVRLEITPEKSPAKTAQSVPRQTAFNPKQKIRKLPTGDVFIEGVPMIDQGDKGYCFPASGERVLRYYGMRADMHEIAQLAGNQGKGTSLTGGLEGLKTAGLRLQFRVRVVDQPGFRDFENLVREYNLRALKFGPKEQIPPLQGVVQVQTLLQKMRPDVLQAARQAQKPEKNRFLRALQGAVDAGHPMIWGVLLGLVPEANAPQTGGGHARLIVGYNARTQECLYSDSWGAGHELKRMSFDQAWLIHQFCFLLIPQGIESPSLSQDK
jgi:hypothetical protein